MVRTVYDRTAECKLATGTRFAGTLLNYLMQIWKLTLLHPIYPLKLLELKVAVLRSKPCERTPLDEECRGTSKECR